MIFEVIYEGIVWLVSRTTYAYLTAYVLDDGLARGRNDSQLKPDGVELVELMLHDLVRGPVGMARSVTFSSYLGSGWVVVVYPG